MIFHYKFHKWSIPLSAKQVRPELCFLQHKIAYNNVCLSEILIKRNAVVYCVLARSNKLRTYYTKKLTWSVRSHGNTMSEVTMGLQKSLPPGRIVGHTTLIAVAVWASVTQPLGNCKHLNEPKPFVYKCI